MSFLLGSANSARGGYEVSNSLRFDNPTDDNLAITFGSAGNRKTFTISAWVKRSAMTTDGSFTIFGAGGTGSNPRSILFFSSDAFRFGDNAAGNANKEIMTNALFRDPSAWYHIVVGVDTTQATDTNRFKMYVNGVLLTSFATATYPAEDADLNWNNSVLHTVGRYPANDAYHMDGYMSEFYFIDGTQYAASDFGETNDDGIWIPKNAKGDLTFGDNGFYLEFKGTGTSTNSSGMGADTSGEDNHLAVNNLTAVDVTTDTCTNNFCTINPIFADAGINTVAADYSQGNTKLLKTVDAWGHGRGTFLLSSGKWYAEAKVTEVGNGQVGQFGIVPSVLSGTTDANDKIEGLRVNMGGTDTIFQKMDTGTGSNVFTDFASGDIVMLAIDLDNNKLWVGNDGTWYNDNNASTTFDASNEDVTLPANDVGWIFTIGGYRDGGNNLAWEFNWGNPAFAISSSNADADGHGNFEFAVPSGFFAVNSKNLAEYG